MTEYQHALESLQSKFTSGNPIPVERAQITRDEWEAVRGELIDRETEVRQLAAQVERLRDKLTYWASKSHAVERGHNCAYRVGLEAALQCSKETPAQSLAAVRAEAVEGYAEYLQREHGDQLMDPRIAVGVAQYARLYAQRIRNGEA